jgi:hypothetical protein
VLVALVVLFATHAEGAAAQPREGELPRAERERMRERFENATPAEREVMRRAIRDRVRDGVRDRVRDHLRDLPQSERRELRRRWENATPAERRDLRREIMRRTLSEDERSRLRGLIEGGVRARMGEELRAVGKDLGGLDPEERRNLRERVRDLPREERRALQRKLSHYRSLPEADMDAQERSHLDTNAERFRALPEDEKQRMRDAWKRLETMPAEKRKALLDQLLGADAD